MLIWTPLNPTRLSSDLRGPEDLAREEWESVRLQWWSTKYRWIQEPCSSDRLIGLVVPMRWC